MNQITIPYPREFLPKQKEVIDALEKHGKKYVMYSGAFGAGKTLLACHVVIRECIKYPNSLWVFVAQTIPNLRDTVVRTFLEEVDLYQEGINKAREKLPKEQQHHLNIRLKKIYLSGFMSFEFFNGSEVLFRSALEPEKFKSLTLSGFAIDEPVDIDEQVFLMLQGRLRSLNGKRIGIMAGNPAGKMNWVYQKFFEKTIDGFYAVHTTTYDNIYLPEDNIRDMETSYDEDYKRRYLYGEWGSFAGMVYKDFDPSKHVGDFKEQECKYHIAGFDDGSRNPACCLAVGIDSDNVAYVKDELYEAGLVESEKTQYVYDMHRRRNFNRIYVAPEALSIIECMRHKKLRAEGADNDIDTGVSKLKSLFKNDLIFIDKGCKNLIKEISSYRYDRGDRIANKNYSEKPIPKDNHACDALRYAMTDFNPYRKPSFISGGRW